MRREGSATGTASLAAASPQRRGPRIRAVLALLGRRVFTRERLVRTATAGISSLAALLFVYWLGLRGVYDLPYALSVLPSLWLGFKVSVEAVAFVIPLGFAFGLLVGWARTTGSVLLRGAAALYVDFFRSLPPIVLISFPYLLALVALHNPNINPYVAENIALWVGAFALSLHTSAYQAEIVRAGILSVPSAQTEAADAIGLSRGRAMFLVTLPQAFRVSLPALGNEFSSVIKDTSLLSVIGWLELSGIGLLQVYAGLRVYAYAPLLVWLEIAALYFVLTFAVNTTVRSIENAFKVPGLEAAI